MTAAATTALGDCLDCLFAKETFGTTHEDVSTIVMVLLRTVTQVNDGCNICNADKIRFFFQCLANTDKNNRIATAVVTNVVSLSR